MNRSDKPLSLPPIAWIRRPDSRRSGRAFYELVPEVSGTLVATATGAFAKTLSLRHRCDRGDPGDEAGCDASVGPAAVQIWVHAGEKIHLTPAPTAYHLALDVWNIA